MFSVLKLNYHSFNLLIESVRSQVRPPCCFIELVNTAGDTVEILCSVNIFQTSICKSQTVCVCSSITIEHLEKFQPNLVYIHDLQSAKKYSGVKHPYYS